MSRTLQELAQEAVDVQDASNFMAVVNGMARAMEDLRSIYANAGTDFFKQHWLSIAWLDKLNHLAGLQSFGSPSYLTRAQNALQECHRVGQGGEPVSDQQWMERIA